MVLMLTLALSIIKLTLHFFYQYSEPLLDLTCLQVSCQLMGKSADEIRNILNIPQMTEQEEKDARRDHRWIFDD
jgi:hypothetical protein